MTSSISPFVSLLAILFFAGCTSPEAEQPKAPAIPVADPEPDIRSPLSASPDGGSANSSGVREYQDSAISFDIPESWREDSQAQMIDSRYFINTDAGELQLTLTSMGGSINDNLDRWDKQVRTEGESATRDEITIAGAKCPRLDTRGRYENRVGRDKGSKKDWRLIGIAIPRPQRNFYIKLVGPRDAVKDFMEEFDDFVSSAKFTD